MENVFQLIVLGIIQGLGEFLPISSTAHLIIVPYFFDWKDQGLDFNVALHVGTLIAVLAYFWKDWMIIIKLPFQDENKKSFIYQQPKKTENYDYKKSIFWYLIIATIPGVLAGYFLEDLAETIFRHPLLIAVTLSVVGLLLYLVDKWAKKDRDLKKLKKDDAVLIGIAQALAIIPGVSRSGATITAGLALGLNRVSAARFSFLLSTPIILGAAIFKIPDLIQGGITVPIVIGIMASAISGYLAIKYLLKFVEKTGYALFFWYRLVLAALIILIYTSR